MRAGRDNNRIQFWECIHGGMANFYDYWEYDAAIGDIYLSSPTVSVAGSHDGGGQLSAECMGFV